jgi:hypothetical protein
LVLYSSDGREKAKNANGNLSNFVPASLAVTLKSSSKEVGAKGLQLTAALTPNTLLRANGRFVIHFPEYYGGAGDSVYMLNSLGPECFGTKLAVTSCRYNPSLRQLTVGYSMNNGKDSRQRHSITVTTFKNPVSVGAKTGFMVVSQDDEGRPIGQSPVLTLGGISKPTTFD